MSLENRTQSGQSTLPETTHENALRSISIEPDPILIGIVQEIHAEQLTSGLITASLRERAKNSDEKLDLAVADTADLEFYKDAVKRAGLIPDPVLVRIVARRHMATLTPSLLIKAYLEFRDRYPHGSGRKKEGEQAS